MAIKFGFITQMLPHKAIKMMNFPKFLSMRTAFAAMLVLVVSFLTSAQAQEATSPAASYAAPVDKSKPQAVMHELILEARLTKKSPPVEKGLVWRVFSPRENKDGKLAIIGSAYGGTSSFELAEGSYLVHAAFGRAGATKRITLSRGGGHETFVLEAGGLKLAAIAGENKINDKSLLFTVYAAEKDENNKRKIIARNVPAHRIVRLNAGTYHVFSEYGRINATVRADLRVQAGKLTEATLQHRAARVTLKLVSEKSGEAIANTAWSVISAQGAVVKESSNTFPTMVLASGNYTAVARNGGIVYTNDFEVKPGKNGNVEVLAKK